MAIEHRYDMWGEMPAEAAREVVEGLYEGGINFVCYLVESEFTTANKAVEMDERFHTISVSQEGAGVAICAGASVGGKRAAVMVGASGFPLTMYPLCWLGEAARMPMLILISTRTFGEQHEIYSHPTALVDPFLQALGIPIRRVTRIKDVRRTIANAARTAYGWWRPIAVVLCEEVIDARGVPWETPAQGT